MNNKTMHSILRQGFFLLFILNCPFVLADRLIVSVRSPEGANDIREKYNVELIGLALDKTKTQSIDYELRPIPVMTRQRVQFAASTNLYPNLIIEETYEDNLVKEGNLIYANFPIDLGILSTRVCFVNPKIKDEVSKVTSIDQLKKYNLAQGAGWADVAILRANGFKVTEISNYEGIFKMTAAARVDLFCRGANELLYELRSFKAIQNLTYNDSFAIFYPMPRFYFTNKSNLALKQRIEKGLQLAYADGSVNKLWSKHFGESVAFANLNKRILFKIENPFLTSLPKDYIQYLYSSNK